MVFELIPHPDQQFRCHCCSVTVQIVDLFSVLFINPQKKVQYMLEGIFWSQWNVPTCSKSTNLKSGTAVQLADMKE